MTTTLTTEEQAGIEQFRASIGTATPLQRQSMLDSLRPGGSVERMKGAPRREVLDEMARILREYDAPTPQPATATAPATPAGTVRVRIAARDQRGFSKAVADAKRVGGKFDPQTKTWLIPADSNFLNAAGAYGWAIVK